MEVVSFLLNEIDNIYSNANRLKDNISLTNTETQSSYDINNPQLNQELDNIVKNSESCINSYKRLFNKCAMELKEISNIMISNINDSANEQPLLTAMNYLNSNINNTENGQNGKSPLKQLNQFKNNEVFNIMNRNKQKSINDKLEQIKYLKEKKRGIT